MKLSEVKLSDVKLAIRVDYDFDDALIISIMDSAKGYMCRYTGLDLDTLDRYPEMIHAFYCLCNDMYEKRIMQVTNGRDNPTVKQILGSVAVNYL